MYVESAEHKGSLEVGETIITYIEEHVILDLAPAPKRTPSQRERASRSLQPKSPMTSRWYSLDWGLPFDFNMVFKRIKRIPLIVRNDMVDPLTTKAARHTRIPRRLARMPARCPVEHS